MRANFENGYWELICTECGSGQLVTEKDSDANTCMECGKGGEREMDRLGLEDWDEKLHGTLGIRLVKDGQEEILTGAIEFTDYNDVGVPTGVVEV